MADNGSEEEGEMCGEKTPRDPKTPLLDAPPWIGAHQDMVIKNRRTVRSGSTESVVTDSISGSEPGSPSRPVTPHMVGGVASGGPGLDSEDSGLGPSPAKSDPCSPLRFDDRCSDSMLDLSPRTEEEEDNNSDSEDMDTKCESAPDSNTPSNTPAFQFLLASQPNTNQEDTERVPDSDNPSSAGFQFLLASESNKVCEDIFEDFEEEEEEEEDASSSSSSRPVPDYSDMLNPKVVLIRSDFSGCYREDSTCSQVSSSGGCAASEDSRAGEVGPESGACKWLKCERPADANASATDLLDHIRECHVNSQPEDAESFVCLWGGCKVYARPSCSRSWLERHVLLHGGSKPFRCIVAGCRQRFGTEAALQRHVNSHFHAHRHAHQGPGQNPGHRLARNRKNKKHRRRPQSNKSKDFFDDATMEYVRHNLFRLSSIEGVVTSGPPAAITFRSIVKGKRKTESGRVNYLLSWSPQNIVPDVWVSEEDLVSEKTIPVSQLPCNTGALQHLLPAMDALGLSNRRKRKRK